MDCEAELARFEVEAKKYFKPYQQKCVSAKGMRFMLEQVDELAERVGRQVDVLELGAGYSTLCFAGSADVCSVVSIEHDRNWARFLQDRLGAKTPICGRDHMAKLKRTFDVVLVDHGPKFNIRVEDLPWSLSRVAPGGILILDDWSPDWVIPRYTEAQRKIMAASGRRWSFVEGGRSGRRGKTVAVFWADQG